MHIFNLMSALQKGTRKSAFSLIKAFAYQRQFGMFAEEVNLCGKPNRTVLMKTQVDGNGRTKLGE
jgi:hypothetical protein